MPELPALYAPAVAAGPGSLDGVELVGLVLDDTYTFDPDHGSFAELAPDEVDGIGYVRPTATASVERIGGVWKLFLDAVSDVDLSDVAARGGIAWGRSTGGGDAGIVTVVWADDPGGPISPYSPTWDSGIVEFPIESITPRVTKLEARTVAGVAVSGTDYSAETVAAVLAPFFNVDGAGPGAVLRSVVAPSDESETVVGVTAGLLDVDLVWIAPSSTGDRARVLLPRPSLVPGQVLWLAPLPSPAGTRNGPSIGWRCDPLPAVLGDFAGAFTGDWSAAGPFDFAAVPLDVVVDVDGVDHTVTLSTDHSVGGVVAAITDLLGQVSAIDGVTLVDGTPTHFDRLGGRMVGVGVLAAGSVEVVSVGGIPHGDLTEGTDILGVREVTPTASMPVAYGGTGAEHQSMGVYEPTSGNHGWTDHALSVMQSMTIVAVAATADTPEAWMSFRVIPRPEWIPLDHTDIDGDNVRDALANAFRAIDDIPDGGASDWGGIGGTLTDQTDLVAALDAAKDRANHTGAQAQSTVTGLVSALATKDPVVHLVPDSVHTSGTGRGTPIASAVNAGGRVIAPGEVYGMRCGIAGLSSRIVIEPSASSLTAGQAVTVVAYLISDTTGLPTAVPVWSQSVTVGTTVTAIDTAAAHLFAPDQFVAVHNPSTNAGSVTLLAMQPGTIGFSGLPSEILRPCLYATGQGAVMGDVSAYTIGSSATATRWNAQQYAPVVRVR